jgi:hypothetical protein
LATDTGSAVKERRFKRRVRALRGKAELSAPVDGFATTEKRPQGLKPPIHFVVR